MSLKTILIPSLAALGLVLAHLPQSEAAGFYNLGGFWKKVTAAASCPTNFSSGGTYNAKSFCIGVPNYDNSTGVNLSSGPSTLHSNCTSMGSNIDVCHYAEIQTANTGGVISLNTVGGTKGTNNGSGSFAYETLSDTHVVTYDVNQNDCHYVNSSGTYTTTSCSQPKSLFCCYQAP